MYALITYIFAFFLYLLPIQTISYGELGIPVSFSPLEITKDSERLVENLVFRKLLSVDAKTGELSFDLAERITKDSDNREYVVVIKKNQYFSDGVEITADDVLFSASNYSSLKEVSFDKIDDYTVKFTLPSSYSPFETLLTFSILPSHIDKNNTNSLTTSSKYRIVKIQRGGGDISQISMVKTTYPFLKFVIHFYGNEEDLILASKLGEINSFMLNNNKDIENFNKQVVVFPARSYVLIFNNKKDYLTKDVKKQILANINFDYLLKNQDYRLASLQKGPLENTWAFDPNVNFAVNFTPRKINLQKNNFLIVGADIEIIRKIISSIKVDLEKNGGLNVDQELIKSSIFQNDIRNHDYDLLVMALEAKNDPDRYVFWHSSQAENGLNYSNISNLRIDKSLERGRDYSDRKTRTEDYRVFQLVFNEELPAYFLFNPTKMFYSKKTLKNIDLKGVFYPYDVLNNVDKWQLERRKIIL